MVTVWGVSSLERQRAESLQINATILSGTVIIHSRERGDSRSQHMWAGSVGRDNCKCNNSTHSRYRDSSHKSLFPQMEKLCLSVVRVICWENLLLREYKLGWEGHSVLSIIQQKYLEGERERERERDPHRNPKY